MTLIETQKPVHVYTICLILVHPGLQVRNQHIPLSPRTACQRSWFHPEASLCISPSQADTVTELSRSENILRVEDGPMTLTNDPGTQHTPGLSQANWTCGHPDHTPSTLTSHLGEPSFPISLLSPLSPPDPSFFTDNQSDALQPSVGSCQASNSTFYDPPLPPLPAPHGIGLCPIHHSHAAFLRHKPSAFAHTLLPPGVGGVLLLQAGPLSPLLVWL